MFPIYQSYPHIRVPHHITHILSHVGHLKYNMPDSMIKIQRNVLVHALFQCKDSYTPARPMLFYSTN